MRTERENQETGIFLVEENLQRHQAIGPNNTVHWSDYEMKGTCFQEASPTRSVTQTGSEHERLSPSPEWEESSNWTEHQAALARHDAWQLQEELHRTTGAYKDVQSTHLFRGYPSIKEEATASTSKPIMKSKNRCFSTCDWELLRSPPGEKNTIRQTNKLLGKQTAHGIVRFTSDANAYIQELGTFFST